MAGLWMRARAELRRQWLGTLGLAVLIGLAGTVVLTGWAGARRTDSAYPHYLTITHAADFLVSTDSSRTSFDHCVLSPGRRLARGREKRDRGGAVPVLGDSRET